MSAQNRGLTVVVPVAEGREDALRDHLVRLPTGPRSPMIRVHGTHFARWVVFRFADKDGRPARSVPPHLLFSSEFDGGLEDYVASLCEGLGQEAHAIWSHCAGYPGEQDGALARYLLDHHIRPGYSVVAYPGVRVEDVRASLALRDRLNEFVMRARELDPPALQRAWLQRFRSGRR
ncbi:MAG TPA: hypothetical protein VF545_05380 [Thermoleophilaceae bacterium]